MAAKTTAKHFYRSFGPIYYEGFCFVESREQGGKIAKLVRSKFGVGCRTITIPQGGYFGLTERYVLMLPTNIEDPVEALAFIRQQPGFAGY